MIRLEDIIEAYLTARKNKRRSPDQVEFELHWHRNCYLLWQNVENRCVQPKAYTFIAKRPKPREVFACDMSTRVLHHYLDIRLRPLLEARMTTHNYNNRKGMGQNACQNAVITDIYEMSKGYTQDAYIIKLDMKGCFPNINQDIAYKQLEEVILNDYNGNDKDELIYILQVCIYSYPTHHCYRKSSIEDWKLIAPDKSIFNKPDGIGSAIGHLVWQNAVNYYFNEIDKWFCSMQGLRYERYVDDMYIIATSKTALLLIPELRTRLAELGARLNENKFYCQHWSKGCECLGIHIKIDRLHPNRRIVKHARDKVAILNNRPKENKVPHLLASLNSYTGIFKGLNGYKQAKKLDDMLNPKWKKYVEFNTQRVCFVAKDGYKTNQLIIKHYGL